MSCGASDRTRCLRIRLCDQILKVLRDLGHQPGPIRPDFGVDLVVEVPLVLIALGRDSMESVPIVFVDVGDALLEVAVVEKNVEPSSVHRLRQDDAAILRAMNRGPR